MGFVEMSILSSNGWAFVENEDGSEKKCGKKSEKRQEQKIKINFYTYKKWIFVFSFFTSTT